jgi:hypothetical protein
MASDAQPKWLATRTPKQALLLALLNSVLAVMSWLGIIFGGHRGLALVLAIGWPLLALAYGTSGVIHMGRLKRT